MRRSSPTLSCAAASSTTSASLTPTPCARSSMCISPASSSGWCRRRSSCLRNPLLAKVAGWRARRSRKRRSSRSIGQEFQGDAVDAIAQSSGRRSVLEDMAQMPAAASAMHFRAWQQQQVVGGGADCVRQRPIEARPTGLAVVFGLRGEQRKIAARAGKRALALLVVERARAGGFGTAPPQHVVLRLGEDGAPFAVALLDFEAVGGLHIAAPQR